jgi:beta-lactam-binding protein with PASTA domain
LLRVTREEFSPDIPQGRIAQQSPEAGTPLKTSRTVKVLISLGDRKYAVPSVVGSSTRAAEMILAQRSFVLGNRTVTHTPKGEPSSILQQSPQPGTQEGTDPHVNVLVSLGPIEESYVMPDFIGRPAELVASRSRAEGFHVGKFNYRAYAGVEPGVVIQQKPEAGNRISKKDIITLEVSQ